MPRLYLSLSGNLREFLGRGVVTAVFAALFALFARPLELSLFTRSRGAVLLTRLGLDLRIGNGTRPPKGKRACSLSD